ncbi:MAG: nuclear transport factor 2 family protein [Alphaproteobacteria bacterium]|jgi:hypothetical protein|nr:nuclear transport factor 2 family protein [Alphaproteobacteria bacterium]
MGDANMADLAARVQRLEDIEDIKKLIAAYAKAVDHNGDPAMLEPLFSEAGSWNCEGIGGWQGKDELVAGLREVCTTTIPWALHYMTQPSIEVAPDGQTAQGEYYLWELGKFAPDDGGGTEDTWIGGWYETSFVKAAGGNWQFGHMELRLKLNSPAHLADWKTPIPPYSD